MKTVSQGWIGYQRNQVHFYNKCKVYIFKEPSQTYIRDFNYISEQKFFKTPKTVASVKIPATPIRASGGTLYFTFYYNNVISTPFSLTPDDVRNGVNRILLNIIYNCFKVEIVDNLVYENDSPRIDYIEFSPTEESTVEVLENADIVSLNYKSHISPVNAELPYQKLSFIRMGSHNVLPKRTPILVKTSQYASEWINLGNGIFFLDEMKKSDDGKTTSYNFIDAFSTFTMKNRTGFVGGSNTFDTHIDYALNTSHFTELGNKIPEEINFDKGGYGIISNTQDIKDEFERSCNVPKNLTVAETLMQIAQATGTCVFMQSNFVVFSDFDKIDTGEQDGSIYQINVLEKPKITSNERVKNISVMRYKFDSSVGSPYPTIVSGNIWNYDSDNNIYYQMIDLDDNYYISSGSGYTSRSYTSNYIYLTSTSGNTTYTITGQKYKDPYILGSVSKEMFKNGTVSISLDAKMSDRKPSGIDGALTLLERVYSCPSTLTCNVRFDTRFECGDIVEVGNDYKIILTDINLNFNGSFKATISGVVWLAPIEAPTFGKSIRSSSDFVFRIYNPNNFDCTLYIDISSATGYNLGTIEANGYLEIKANKYNTLDFMVAEWLNETLSNDIYVWLEDKYGNVSENTIILEENW